MTRTRERKNSQGKFSVFIVKGKPIRGDTVY